MALQHKQGYSVQLTCNVWKITSCAACNGACTICPRTLQVVTDFNSHPELSAWRSPRTLATRVIALHPYA